MSHLKKSFLRKETKKFGPVFFFRFVWRSNALSWAQNTVISLDQANLCYASATLLGPVYNVHKILSARAYSLFIMTADKALRCA